MQKTFMVNNETLIFDKNKEFNVAAGSMIVLPEGTSVNHILRVGNDLMIRVNNDYYVTIKDAFITPEINITIHHEKYSTQQLNELLDFSFTGKFNSEQIKTFHALSGSEIDFFQPIKIDTSVNRYATNFGDLILLDQTRGQESRVTIKNYFTRLQSYSDQKEEQEYFNDKFAEKIKIQDEEIQSEKKQEISSSSNQNELLVEKENFTFNQNTADKKGLVESVIVKTEEKAQGFDKLITSESSPQKSITHAAIDIQTILNNSSKPQPTTAVDPFQVNNLTLSQHSFAENLAAGTRVANLGFSGTAGNGITYSLVNGIGATHNNDFTIVGNELRTKVAFDYETLNNLSIRVKLTNSNGQSYEKALGLSVTNVNEAATSITLDHNQINENSAIGTVVGRFSNNDPDSANTFSYSLVHGAGSTDNNAFQIVGNELRSHSPLNYEVKNNYSIRVLVSDGLGGNYEQIITVHVNDVNEAMTDINLSANHLNENNNSGNVIGIFSNNDPDTSDTFVYSLVAGAGATDNSAFQIVGNQLRSNQSFNYEAKNSYSIRVQVNDNDGHSYQKIMTIHINDVNEAATDLALSHDAIAENASIGSTIGTFSNNDPDSGNTFVYTLVAGAGGADNASFSIVNNQLVTNANYDYGVKNSYSIRVEVDDQLGGKYQEIFTIHITDENSAPILDNSDDLILSTINENQTTNTGNLISEILSSDGGDPISDVDSGAVEGIAIYNLNSSNGTWEYSTDNGSNWSAVGAVDANNALLLRATDKIRFIPDGENSDTASVDFYAWDQTSGTAGNKVDVTTRGTTTAFSTASETASVTVTAVNDAPVLDNSGDLVLTTITEDQTTNNGNLISDILSSHDSDPISDVDSGAVEGIAIYNLNSGNGTWEYSTDNGSNWSAVGAVDANNALLLRATDKIRFIPDGENSDTASVDFYAWDQTSGTAGNKVDVTTRGTTTAFSTASETAVITVTAVNDAPVLSNLTNTTFTESTNGSTTIVIDSAITLADVDNGDYDNATLTVELNAYDATEILNINNSAAGLGAVQRVGNDIQYHDGNNWITIGAVGIGASQTGNAEALQITFNSNATVARVERVLEHVSYTSSDYNPPASRTVSITVTDGDGGTTGAQNLTINITAVANNLTLTGGNDNFVTDGQDDIFNTTIANYDNVNDVINAGSGDDVLNISGGGTTTLNNNISNLEKIILSDNNYTITTGTITGLEEIDATGLTGTNALTLNAGSYTTRLVVESGDGIDTITTGSGDDLISTGAGADIINAGTGNDLVMSGAGNDIIYVNLNDYTSDDLFDGGADDDLIYWTGGGTKTLENNLNNIEWMWFDNNSYNITLNAGNTSLNTVNLGVNATADKTMVMDGSALSHNMWYAAGLASDTIIGGSGDDVFAMRASSYSAIGDSFDGGLGTDILYFVGNDNTLVFGNNFTSIETIWLSDAAYDITLHAGNTSFITILGAENNSLTLNASATTHDFTVQSGLAADYIILGSGNHTLYTGGGNDQLTFANANFDANDIIDGGAGTDRIIFADSANISAADNANKTSIEEIQLLASNNQLVFTNAFVSGADNDELELIYGANTITSLDTSLVDSQRNVILNGTALVQLANNAGNRVLAKAGVNINVVGGTGADTIIGNSGDDIITGGAGTDFLTGGSGADFLTGGSGADQFIYTDISHSGVGHGNRDIINDFNQGEGDTINLEAMVNNLVFNYDAGFIGNGYASAYYSQAGGNTFLHIDSTGDGNANSEIQLTGTINLTDADVIVDTPTQNGTSGNNALTGTAGADIIYGRAGDDTITGADGNDILQGHGGADTINGGRGDDLLIGNDGNDILTGGYGGDTINGGAGDDIIYADNVAFDKNSIASLKLWLDAGDLFGNGALSSNGDAVNSWVDKSNNAFTFTAVSAPTLIKNVLASGRSSVEFTSDYLILADNGTFDFTNNFSIFANAHTDDLAAFQRIFAKGAAGTGYGAGNGNGKYLLTSWGKVDYASTGGFTEGVDQSVGWVMDNAYDVAFYGNGAYVNTSYFNSGPNLNDLDVTIGGMSTGASLWRGNISQILVFNTALTAAQSAIVSEYLAYQNGVALATMAFGVDKLTGGSGADQFFWTNASHSGVGNGNRDIITDFSGSGGEGDKINIEGVVNGLVFNYDDGFISNGYASSYYSHSGGNTILHIDFGGDGVADMEIQLTGTINLTDADVIVDTPTQNGTSGNDTLTGTGNADILYGRDGDDTLHGLAGNDILQGHGGNDTIYGGDGNDLILGNDGNDNLLGDRGNDIIFGGDGNDIIVGGYGGDTINGGDGDDIIYADNVAFTSSSISGLILWLDAGNLSTSQFAFANGESISSWQDGSVNNFLAYDASAGTTTDQPIYNNNWSNGRSAISFGGNNFLQIDYNAAFNLTNNITAITVADTNNLNAGYYEILSTDGQVPGKGFAFGRFDDTGLFTNFWVKDYTTADPYWDNNVAQLSTYSLDANYDVSFYKNGEYVSTTLHNAPGNGSTSGPIFVGGLSGNACFWEGDMGDVILFNRTLTPSEQAILDEYLSLKYGIPLPGFNFDINVVDTLTGGSGADQFIWTNASHSGVGNGYRDIITDFSGSGGEGDKINIEGVVNGLVFNYDDGFISNGYASSYYSHSGGNTILHIDFGGDGIADMEIQLTGTINLTDADVIVDTPTQNGTSGNDTLTGTVNADILYGRDGDDTLHGLAGNDILQGHGGNDTIYGGDGNDLILGNDGNDYLYGGYGNDVIHGGDGTDIVYGEHGNDVLYGGDGTDSLVGGFGSDTLNGGAGNDMIYADSNIYFDQSALANMVLWLNASNYAGNNTHANQGDFINTWTDLSGSGAHATTINQSTYNLTSNTINGRATINFDGSDFYTLAKTSTELGLINSDYEMFFIAKTSSTNIQFLVASSVSEQYEGHINGDAGYRTISDTGRYGDVGGNSQYDDGSPYLFASRVQADMGYARVNGVDGAPTATGAQSEDDAYFYLGQRSGNQYMFSGQIAEVIFINTSSIAQRGLIEEYLSYKYGISMNGVPLGVDTLTGGAGNDTFVWTNMSHSDATNSDRITDFKVNGDADKIELQLDDTIYLIGDTGTNAVWGAQAGQLLWFDNGGQAKIQIDWGGDGAADFGIQLNNIADASTITSADFIFHKVVGSNASEILNGGALNDNIIGGGGNDTINGGAGNDYLDGGAGVDVILGGDGDDIIILDLNDLTAAGVIDGGAGNDILRFDGSGQTLDLHANTTFNPIINIERIDLDPGNNTITLDEVDVAALSSTLYIDGNDANDIVNVAKAGVTDWTDNGTTVINTITYHHYSLAGTNLYVQDGVTINLNV
ncbi:MAG: cadherin domain-containing protein [Legionellales bacterium]|nr:cadherin domain-containing protein [Legionellales bacterium]